MPLLSLLQNKYALGGIAVVAIVLGFRLWLSAHDDGIRNEEKAKWELKIATAPVKTKTTFDTLYFPSKPLKTSGPAHPLVIVPTGNESCDSLRELLADCMEDKETSLYDSAGGRHEISYYPKKNLFDEEYIPPIKQLIKETVSESKQVLVIDEHHWWLMLTPSKANNGYGVGGFLGYKAIGVGYLRLPDTDVWQVGVHLDF